MGHARLCDYEVGNVPCFLFLMPSQIQRASLRHLFRQLLDDSIATDRECIRQAISVRGHLASMLYAPKVAAAFNAVDLDFAIGELECAQATNPAQDPITDAIEREVARVQLTVLQRERDRRLAALVAVQRGDFYSPNRDELAYWVNCLAFRTIDGLSADVCEQQVSEVVSWTRKRLSCEAQDPIVVPRLLRDAARIPLGCVSDALRPWIYPAIVLELLIKHEGFAGHRIDVAPIIRDTARQTWRLFYCADRAIDDMEVRLDLSAEEVADLVENQICASREWEQLGLPVDDQRFYTTPLRREEPGRPPAHAQIVHEAQARELAERAGGFPAPLLLAIPPADRTTTVRRIWSKGLACDAENSLGLTLYPAIGDSRVRWGMPPHPYGLLCAVVLPANFVLHVGDDRRRDDHARFEELSRQAAACSRDSVGYTRKLRELLKREGYYAVAQHDPIRRQIHEVTVLTPTPETVMVIRETIPSFARQRDMPHVTPTAVSRTALSRCS